ncbi:MAG TPA: LysM peptidoglycan-binding domain-containing protein [Gammaproteobacteria bacterium]|nr:LysM peptidoglycan-binding domain-containing protein [Gammaproteobacteria bacterium]
MRASGGILSGLLLLLTACTGSHPPFRVMTSQYKVHYGDTLESIAWRYGLNYQEVAAWNRLKPPYHLVPGQRIALNPPVGYKPPRAPAVRRANKRTSRRPQPVVIRSPVKKIPVAPPKTVVAPPVPPASPETWLWPIKGKVVRHFSPGDRGIDILGQFGGPVVAVAQGKVVYSGDALKGYGQLIIIKHSDALLSAYAHNRLRLVTQGMLVNRGQKIAEIGRAQNGQPLLHFEIREGGMPVNPLNFLPH